MLIKPDNLTILTTNYSQTGIGVALNFSFFFIDDESHNISQFQRIMTGIRFIQDFILFYDNIFLAKEPIYLLPDEIDIFSTSGTNLP